VIYQSDDLIGMGDFSAVAEKVTGLVGKAGKLFRKLKKKTGKTAGKVARAAAPAEPSAAPVVQASAGGGAMDFIKRNPIAVAGIALVGIFLLARKRG